MGGCFQAKTFETLEGLLEEIEEQIRGANACGLYLLQAEIKQKPFPWHGFEWVAYFSK